MALFEPLIKDFSIQQKAFCSKLLGISTNEFDSCDDKEKAMMFAVEHNQESIYDAIKDRIYVNPFYDKKTNPIR